MLRASQRATVLRVLVALVALRIVWVVARHAYLLGRPDKGFRFPPGQIPVHRALLDTGLGGLIALSELLYALRHPSLLLRVVRAHAGSLEYSYGPHARHRASVFCPAASAGRPPLILFIRGGAWAWGSRATYAAFCRELADATGAVVVCADFRAYPDGNGNDMVQDVVSALAWARARGGALWRCDTGRVALLGHSAGAHLTLQAALRLAQLAAPAAVLSPPVTQAVSAGDADASTTAPSSPHTEANNELQAAPAAASDVSSGGGRGTGEMVQEQGSPPSSSAPTAAASAGPAAAAAAAAAARELLASLVGAVGVAGVYDIRAHHDHEASRSIAVGSVHLLRDLARISPMHPVMGGPACFDSHSPAVTVARLTPAQAAAVPRLFLLHGDADETVPLSSSQRLHGACARAGVPCELRAVAGMDHASCLVEVMRGALGGPGGLVVAAVRHALAGGGPAAARTRSDTPEQTPLQQLQQLG